MCSVSLFAQKFETHKKLNRYDKEIVNAEFGVIFPMGNLKNKFEYAQSYGFWFNSVREKDFMVELGISIFFPKEARPIQYQFQDSIHTIESRKYGLDFGLRLDKIIQFSDDKKLILDTTIGINYLDYKFPKDESKDAKKDNGAGFKNTTFLIAPEIKYIYQNVGLKLQYRFTPYNVIEGMESNFGSSSILIGIIYKQ